MKKLCLALVAIALTAPAGVAAQDVAPAVKRKPAPAAAHNAQHHGQHHQPASTAGRQTEQQYQAALTAAVSGDGSDSALDASLIRGMSRLLAAGKCREAAGLAVRDGRKELASRAQQLCR